MPRRLPTTPPGAGVLGDGVDVGAGVEVRVDDVGVEVGLVAAGVEVPAGAATEPVEPVVPVDPAVVVGAVGRVGAVGDGAVRVAEREPRSAAERWVTRVAEDVAGGVVSETRVGVSERVAGAAAACGSGLPEPSARVVAKPPAARTAAAPARAVTGPRRVRDAPRRRGALCLPIRPVSPGPTSGGKPVGPGSGGSHTPGAWQHGRVSEEQKQADNRARATTDELRAFIREGWAPRRPTVTEPAAAAGPAAARRALLSAAFPKQRLVVPAGGLKVRSNDTDYVFRPHTAFAYLTGLGADREPDAVLVLEPVEDADGTSGHEAVLYFRPLADRDSDEFFADARYGEFWVGARPSIEDVELELGLTARHVDGLVDAVTKDAGQVTVRVVRDADTELTARLDAARVANGAQEEGLAEADDALAHDISHLRMCKDDHEVEQMRAAVAATHEGFDAMLAALPEAVEKGRGERWLEGTFGLHARHGGNGVGYDSICAAGDHANTLHWIKNTGDVRPGELVLIDAGVEVDSLYTADITRTVPVDGTFTDAQREVYEAVLAAQEAGIAAVRPGARFSDVHKAAIRVVAEHLHAWGLLPEGVSVDDTLDTEHGQYHRRWMVHGTSHHLGLDVHDCALATREEYMDAELKPGMVLTVEPGLYFKADDLLAPERFRGIGVRIEDDVLVTEDGCENLSAAMPRTVEDVEAWLARVQGR